MVSKIRTETICDWNWGFCSFLFHLASCNSWEHPFLRTLCCIIEYHSESYWLILYLSMPCRTYYITPCNPICNAMPYQSLHSPQIISHPFNKLQIILCIIHCNYLKQLGGLLNVLKLFQVIKDSDVQGVRQVFQVRTSCSFVVSYNFSGNWRVWSTCIGVVVSRSVNSFELNTLILYYYWSKCCFLQVVSVFYRKRFWVALVILILLIQFVVNMPLAGKWIYEITHFCHFYTSFCLFTSFNVH